MTVRRSLSARERLLELAVGGFFFAGLVLLGVFTIILQKDLLWKERIRRTAVFPTVGGVSEGDKVLVRGMQVGKVAGMALKEDASGVRLELEFGRRVPLYRDHVVQVRISSIVGGQYVYIEPGTPASGALPPDAELNGSGPSDLMRSAADVIHDLQEKRFFANLNTMAQNLSEVTAIVRDGRGTVGKLIHDDSLYEEAKVALKSVSSLSEIGPRIEAALKDVKSTGASVTKAADSVAAAGQSLRAAGDSVRTAAENLNAAVGEARAGQGTLGKLLTDDRLYEELRAAMGDFRKAVARFDGEAVGNSSLARLLSDDGKLYVTVERSFSSIREAADAAREFAQKVKHGEGTLGKLVNDDTLYRDARQTVDEVRGAIRDFREQAPISTFGSLMLGTF